ncbi:MAG: hypothetical protein M3071_21525 [Actinomycetota bacterium]|nr:hypothetical protein [Actinomycetota bacterium]
MLAWLPNAAVSPLGWFLAVAFGFVVAAFGHIVKSRIVILVGLAIIAGVSAYVSFVLHPR